MSMVSMHKSKLDVYGFHAQKQTHQLLEIILLYHKSEHVYLCWLIVVKAPYLQTDYRIVVRRLVDTPLSRVTRLGKISPFGNFLWRWANFFLEKIAQ
jgi:hypothetical protein